MKRQPNGSFWDDEPAVVREGEPRDLDELVPPEQERRWFFGFMAQLEGLAVVLFVAVFIFMLVQWLAGGE